MGLHYCRWCHHPYCSRSSHWQSFHWHWNRVNPEHGPTFHLQRRKYPWGNDPSKQWKQHNALTYGLAIRALQHGNDQKQTWRDPRYCSGARREGAVVYLKQVNYDLYLLRNRQAMSHQTSLGKASPAHSRLGSWKILERPAQDNGQWTFNAHILNFTETGTEKRQFEHHKD